MKEKIKLFARKYLIGFTIGAILFGTIGVYAVTYFPGINTTYDNSDSGMTSTNVQDALDELYNVCVPPKASDQILEDAGLEQDSYECRYFFTGANPNNYITFNGETWRIISVECDGTIKIIRDTSIGGMARDTSNQTGWTRPATLNNYLNSTYYNSLNENSKNQITSHTWKIGGTNGGTIDTIINDESSKEWNGKIGLISLSEYMRVNPNITKCNSIEFSGTPSTECINNNWINSLILVGSIWVINSQKVNDNLSYSIGLYDYHLSDVDADNKSIDVIPVLYLSSDITITGGDGSESKPYTIE